MGLDLKNAMMECLGLGGFEWMRVDDERGNGLVDELWYEMVASDSLSSEGCACKCCFESISTYLNCAGHVARCVCTSCVA